MSFRAKVRKALKGTKSNGDDSPTSPSHKPAKRTDIEYYKPGEIPRSKYRGPWNQKHQDKLHAFSFEDAFRDRKASIAAAQSPRGTMAQSRRSSWVSRVRSSLDGRSDVEDGSAARSKSHGSHVGQVVEAAEDDDDDDVGNVGLSRRPTTEQRNSEEASKLEMEKTLTQGDVKQENSHPFTSDELSKAMTAATLNSNR